MVVLIVFPVIFQTIINVIMLSIGGQGTVLSLGSFTTILITVGPRSGVVCPSVTVVHSAKPPDRMRCHLIETLVGLGQCSTGLGYRSFEVKGRFRVAFNFRCYRCSLMYSYRICIATPMSVHNFYDEKV